MQKAFRLVVFLLGIGAAVYLVAEHGQTVRESLSRVGWGFSLYLAASFVVYALDTWGWRLVFGQGLPSVGFARLFSIRMAGEAVNKVTPLASMGGEPLKAYLLNRCGADTAEALTSVAVAKNIMTLAQIAFIFVGVLVAITMVPAKSGALLGFAVFPGIILTAMAVTGVLDHRLRRARKPSSGNAASSPDTQPPVTKAAASNNVMLLWSQFADFFWAHPGAVLLSFSAFFLGWAAGALELLSAAYLLGFRLTITEAVAYEALLASVTMATFFIPAQAGSQEGGFAFLAPLLGLPPYGVALAVLRRCRDLVWVLYGLAYLAITEGRILVSPAAPSVENAA
jgi:uncharacterized protein (TIRG00374 family)